MGVILFIARHWHDILVVGLLIISMFLGIAKWVKENGPIFKGMSLTERIAYITRLLTNLAPIAIILVTDAEIAYGAGMGVLKRSYVIDELYKRIPDEYQKYITEKNLDDIIDVALEKAEGLWNGNSKVSRLVYGGTHGEHRMD